MVLIVGLDMFDNFNLITFTTYIITDAIEEYKDFPGNKKM